MKKVIIEQNGFDPMILSVPEGASVRIEDGVTLVEPKRYIPKVGDCVFAKNPYSDASCYFVCGGFDEDGDPFEMNEIRVDAMRNTVDFDCIFMGYSESYTFTKITPEELQAEFNKRGYEYDFESHTAKKLVWKPKMGEDYKWVTMHGRTMTTTWANDSADLSLAEMKNCFHPDDTDGIEKYIAHIKSFER